MTQAQITLVLLLVAASVLNSASQIAERRATRAESIELRSGEPLRKTSQTLAIWSAAIYAVVVVRVMLVAFGFEI